MATRRSKEGKQPRSLSKQQTAGESERPRRRTINLNLQSNLHYELTHSEPDLSPPRRGGCRHGTPFLKKTGSHGGSLDRHLHFRQLKRPLCHLLKFSDKLVRVLWRAALVFLLLSFLLDKPGKTCRQFLM